MTWKPGRPWFFSQFVPGPLTALGMLVTLLYHKDDVHSFLHHPSWMMRHLSAGLTQGHSDPRIYPAISTLLPPPCPVLATSSGLPPRGGPATGVPLFQILPLKVCGGAMVTPCTPHFLGCPGRASHISIWAPPHCSRPTPSFSLDWKLLISLLGQKNPHPHEHRS